MIAALSDIAHRAGIAESLLEREIQTYERQSDFDSVSGVIQTNAEGIQRLLESSERNFAETNQFELSDSARPNLDNTTIVRVVEERQRAAEHTTHDSGEEQVRVMSLLEK